jgi:hypothetical protein
VEKRTMKQFRIVRMVLVLLVSLLLAQGARAQLVDTKIENGEVVYIEGNALVVKYANGELRQFEMPENSKFSVDGKDMTVHELKPGMKLTTVFSTTVEPRLVDTVKVIDMGTVWKIIGSNLIITTPGGENKMYRVPSGGSVTIGGVEKSLDQLHPGDLLTATVVVTRGYPEPGSAVTSVLRAPPTPARVGALLIDEGMRPIEPNGDKSAVAEAPGSWKSPVVLLLILVLLIVAVLVIRTLRRKRKAVMSH